MPTPEQTRLLALADEKPLQALHASAGRFRRWSAAPELFMAIYVPSPVSDEYTVMLNANVHFDHRFYALRMMVIHHVEAHDRTNVYVLKRDQPDCVACRSLVPRDAPSQRTPAEQREHSLRRSRAI